MKLIVSSSLFSDINWLSNKNFFVKLVMIVIYYYSFIMKISRKIIRIGLNFIQNRYRKTDWYWIILFFVFAFASYQSVDWILELLLFLFMFNPNSYLYSFTIIQFAFILYIWSNFCMSFRHWFWMFRHFIESING